MEHGPDLTDDVVLLRSRGLRVTPQRLYVLATLRKSAGHVAADEIAGLVRQELPSLNLATVYRALNDLREAGLIAETNMGEKAAMYELVQVRHHHIVCERCGSVSEVEDDLFDPVKRLLHDRHGFQARMDHFAIFGLCAGCAQPTGSTMADPAGS